MAGNKRWSKKEIQDLRKNYQGTDIGVLQYLLKGRSIAAIHKKASDLGIAFKWDEKNESIALLKEVLERLRRIEAKLEKRQGVPIIWTKEDEEIIKNNYKSLSDYELTRLLKNGAQAQSIAIKRRSLGLIKKKGHQRNYNVIKTEEFIVQNYKKISTTEISQKVNLKYMQVQYLIRKLKKENRI